MKRFFILTYTAFITCHIANAQLTIYAGLNRQGASSTCLERTIYTDANIPSSLINQISSISLSRGYMAVLAENTDGTGEGFNYIASASNINVNLAGVLQNKVSFIRVLPILTGLKKKGVGSTDPTNVVATALNGGWLYDWGSGDASTTTREYAPMAWGKGGASVANVTNVINKTDVTCYLAFNEPDNADQSNVPYADAVTAYKNMLRSGMRMGSPATTENEYRFWLQDFTTLANTEKARIDFVAVHWYDWGNWTSSNPDNNVNAVGIFNRFKSYIDAVYTRYGKPIWITEFNANPNRGTAYHQAFMALALPWLETSNKVERYAYFFPATVPATTTTTSGILTAAGQVYSNHTSTNAYPANITDPRGSAVTPVELVDFKGQNTEGGNLLTWRTASEANNSHFDVERSNDGSRFEKIGTVKGNGTSQKAHDYTFLDKQAQELYYYRLRQVDFDGKHAFSPMISLNKSGKSIKITPSVSDQFLSLDMPFAQATVVVSDILGRITLAQTLNNGQSIDISRLATGHYVVSVVAKGDNATARFFKN